MLYAPNDPDFTVMEAPEMLKALSDDASQWAKAFRQTALKLGYSDMDEGWLIGWFANAIEYSADVRRWRSESPTKPVVTAPFPG